MHRILLIFSHAQDSGQWTGEFNSNEEPVDWEEHQQLFDLQMEVAEWRCHHTGHRADSASESTPPSIPLLASRPRAASRQ